MPSVVALIPARSGSKRVSDKNVRELAGHPLIAYTIAVVRQSDVFDDVIVSTNSERIADIARRYGADVPFLRPDKFSDDLSPDIEWVFYTLNRLREKGLEYDCFSILRPTSPFRKPETIRRAWKLFLENKEVDSLRAVEKCSQHPGKMWVIRGQRMFPLLPFGPSDQPWHSSQYQSLPEIYVQNASLEIAWTRVVFQDRTIAGSTLIPFVTEGYEGFDINVTYDLKVAEELVNNGEVELPSLSK